MLYGLKEHDIKTLMDIFAWWNHRAETMRARPQPGGDYDDQLAPEVYIARTPDGGIPALNVEIPAPSIITGTGTDIYDEPGSATCTIYAMRSPVYGTGPDELRSAGFSKTVYNLGLNPIPGNSWVDIERDKFGRWFVTGSGSTANTGGTATCATVMKVLIGSCVEGTVRKLIFGFFRCCDCQPLATICVTEPSDCAGYCGPSGTGSIGPPTGLCPCTGLSPLFEVFTVSGITDGSTTCTPLNKNWCLKKVSDCYWVSFASGDGTVASMTVFVDGSAFLVINYANISILTYYLPVFTCGISASNVFSFLSQSSNCGSPPATITVTGTNTPVICSTGSFASTHGCSACNSHTFATLTVPAGWTNGTCTLCANIPAGGPYTLTQSVGACTWLLDPSATGLVCGAVGFASFELIDNGTTGWDLYVVFSVGPATIAIYHLDYSAWSCTAANIMNLVSSTGLCNVTATVTVQFV